MSVRSSVRATPGLLRACFLDSLAYRAELIVWILATSMPLVMLALGGDGCALHLSQLS